MAKRFLIWFWSRGGGSVFAVNLAHRLRLRFGSESVALSLRADDASVERARAMGLDVRVATGASDRRKPLQTVAALAENRRVLGEHAADADVVIVPMNFASAAPLSIGLKQPLVYCAHDPEPHPGDYARVLQRVTQAVLLRRAQKVVALSGYGASRLRALGVPDRKLVVAPLQSVFQPVPQKLRTDPPTRMLFAGRMMAYKGADLLAQALNQIAARDDWRLTIAGDGPALDVETFSMPQIERVTHGWITDDDLDNQIADADLLLFPYRSATQSGVLAQGIATGKASIVTPVGALPEQAGASAWVAENVDVRAIGQSLQAALDDCEARAQRAGAAISLARAAWERDAWAWLAEV